MPERRSRRRVDPHQYPLAAETKTPADGEHQGHVREAGDHLYDGPIIVPLKKPFTAPTKAPMLPARTPMLPSGTRSRTA
jgi:hypothetical protein